MFVTKKKYNNLRVSFEKSKLELEGKLITLKAEFDTVKRAKGDMEKDLNAVKVECIELKNKITPYVDLYADIKGAITSLDANIINRVKNKKEVICG